MELNRFEEQIEEAVVQLDEEEVETLLLDCLVLVDQLLERSNNPKWLLSSATDLHKRLNESLGWYHLH